MTITNMMCMKSMKSMNRSQQNSSRIHTNYCTKIKWIIQKQYGFIEIHVVGGHELLVRMES
jgi:hypothetical protein